MARLFIAALTAATMLLPGAFRQAAHAAEPEFTFSLNLAIPPTHQRWTQAIKPWVEEIEKRSAGRIKIEPYFAGALSSQQEVMESVRNGIADMGESSYAVGVGRFLFHEQLYSIVRPSRSLEDPAAMAEAMEKAFPEAAARDWEGTRYLLTEGMPVGVCIGTNKKITRLEDLRGLKLGVPGGGIALDRARAMGITVVGINMPDMYMSIEKGVIEGFIGDPDVITARRLGELVKYYTLLNLRGSLFYLTMNQDSYDSLPDDLKKVVDDVSGDFARKLFTDFWNGTQYNSLKRYVTEMKGELLVLSDEDYAKADKLLEPIDQLWVDAMNRADMPGEAMLAKFRELEETYTAPWAESSISGLAGN